MRAVVSQTDSRVSVTIEGRATGAAARRATATLYRVAARIEDELASRPGLAAETTHVYVSAAAGEAMVEVNAPWAIAQVREIVEAVALAEVCS